MKKFTSILCMLAAMATAQEKKAEEPKQDKIVISATKTDNSLEEETVAIGVVTRDEMDKNQVRDLNDALSREAGVSTNGAARAQAQRPIIRGLSGARVLTVIDGVRQNFDSTYRGKLYVDFDLLKQVEVVRGPASALWGSGALGGVLSLQTIDPSDLLDDDKEWGLKLSSGFDSVNDGLRFGSTVFGRTDQFEYLFNVSRQESNNYELGGGDSLEHSSLDNYSTLSKLIWHVTENDKLNFQYQTFYADERKPIYEIASDQDIIDQEAKRDSFQFGYEHDDVNDIFNLSFNAYYTKQDFDDEAYEGVTWNQTDTSYETYGFELRNNSIFAQGDNIVHTLTYGVEYFHDEQEGERDGEVYPVFRDAEQDTFGVYIQDEIAIGEKLVITPGVRYDSFDSESDNGDTDADKFNPKLGLLYHLTDDIDVYANYSQGMRGPTLREIYFDGNVVDSPASFFPSFSPGFKMDFLPNYDLEEEESENFDVGFRIDKSNILSNNDNLKFNYTFFHSEYDNFIALNTDGGYDFINNQVTLEQQYVNIKGATIYGHEIEGQYATGNFVIWANYTYNHGEDDENDAPLYDIPAQTINYGIDYSLTQDISLGYSGQFVDTQDRLGINSEGDVEDEIAGYNLHAVYARYAPSSGMLKGWALTVGVDNLFDEEYQYGINDDTFGVGRNIKTTLSYTVQF